MHPISKPNTGKQCFGHVSRFGAGLAFDLDRALHDVFQSGAMGPQVELLEHHTKPRAQLFDLAGIAGFAVFHLNLLAVNGNLARRRYL